MPNFYALPFASCWIIHHPADDLLQSPHLLAHGRLSPGTRGGGPRHASVSDNGQKRTQQVDLQIVLSRSRRGVTLTCHGELLVAYANRVIDLNAEIIGAGPRRVRNRARVPGSE
jgi:hypothetical protein